jgi:hypothetical protein
MSAEGTPIRFEKKNRRECAVKEKGPKSSTLDGKRKKLDKHFKKKNFKN